MVKKIDKEITRGIRTANVQKAEREYRKWPAGVGRFCVGTLEKWERRSIYDPAFSLYPYAARFLCRVLYGRWLMQKIGGI